MKKLLFTFCFTIAFLGLAKSQADLPTIASIIDNSGIHMNLAAAINAAELKETLDGEGEFTVFAPTDEAFGNLPDGVLASLSVDVPGLTDLLLYHVLGFEALSSSLENNQVVVTLNGQGVTATINDDGIFINNARVEIADIPASNGVIHVINAVLIPQPTVADIIENSDVHNTLENLLTSTELLPVLDGEGTFTVFAPTDDAFSALPSAFVQALVNDNEALTNLLLYHVLDSEVLVEDLFDGQMNTTLNGEEITVTINAEGVFINEARVIVQNLQAVNGVVHVVNAVIQPIIPTITEIVQDSEIHTRLENALGLAGFLDLLNSEGEYTLFAPTDDAFFALPEGTFEVLVNDIPTLSNILRYHVLGFEAVSSDLSDGQIITTLIGEDITVTINEDGIFINDARVEVADIPASNGVVHVINAVLLPPADELPTIAQIVEESDIHNTLAVALNTAGLLGTLSGEGTFTLFAPTDEAFSALPAGTIPALLEDIPALTNILLYHVLGIEALSEGLANNQMVMTLNGQNITVTINEEGIFINDARVEIADIPASNGVVHVINAVLLPPAIPITPCYPTSIISYEPRKQNDGSTIAETRTIAANALGMPENSDATTSEDNLNFVSLGFGGEIILGFDVAIKNGPNDDIMVYETTFNPVSNNCNRWPEKIQVYASQDNCNWVYLGEGCQDASFDLGPLAWAQYFRLRDVSDPSGGFFANRVDDGYNLDGIACLNGPEENPVITEANNSYATSVVSYTPQLRRDNSPIAGVRANSSNALGAPQNTDAINFVALGFGGELVLKFDYVIFDGEGPDLRIVETSYGNPSCESYPEKAIVEGSLDGQTWIELTESALCQDGDVDINNAGAIQYIRIRDRSARSNFSGSADGYDVDAVVVLTQCGEQNIDSERIADNVLTPDEETSFVAYPNPFNGFVNIDISTTDRDNSALIEISNCLDQQVSSERVNVASSSNVLHQINASGLNNGIYFITVTTNSMKETKRVVKN